MDVRPGFGKDMQFLQSISTIIYAFACHVGVFPVLNSLHNPTRKRVQKVFRRATLLDIVCYLIIGFSGYLTQPQNTPDLILERDKIPKVEAYLIREIVFNRHKGKRIVIVIK